MKLICEALGISINTLRHLSKLKQIIIDLEIKYKDEHFTEKIMEKLLLK